MSGRTVRWILHRDLNSHPYKKIIVQAFTYQDTENWRTLCENLLKAKVTTTITILSWQMKQIFIFLAASILRTDDIEQLRTLAMFVRNLHILRMLCLLLCNIFWVDRSLVLWRRGRQTSNPLYRDALLISGNGFADNWCWSPGCLVSARRGNGLQCEECNASSQRGVPS